MGRRHALVALVLAVLAVVLIWRLAASLDAIVAREIERRGSAVTGTEVEVAEVEIDLSSGTGTVRGLRVANPPGYEGDTALRLDEIVLQIEPASLAGRAPVVLERVEIRAPEVFYVADADGGSNIQTLVDHARAEDARAEEPGAEAPPAEEEAEPVRLAVRSFRFAEGRLHADARALGVEPIEAEMPPLALEDLGGAAGATPGELGATVLRAYGREVLSTVARKELRGRLHDLIDEKAGGAADALKGLVDEVLE